MVLKFIFFFPSLWPCFHFGVVCLYGSIPSGLQRGSPRKCPFSAASAVFGHYEMIRRLPFFFFSVMIFKEDRAHFPCLAKVQSFVRPFFI